MSKAQTNAAGAPETLLVMVVILVCCILHVRVCFVSAVAEDDVLFTKEYIYPVCLAMRVCV